MTLLSWLSSRKDRISLGNNWFKKVTVEDGKAKEKASYSVLIVGN